MDEPQGAHMNASSKRAFACVVMPQLVMMWQECVWGREIMHTQKHTCDVTTHANAFSEASCTALIPAEHAHTHTYAYANKYLKGGCVEEDTVLIDVGVCVCVCVCACVCLVPSWFLRDTYAHTHTCTHTRTPTSMRTWQLWYTLPSNMYLHI